MKNLGKIVLFLFLAISAVHAGVRATVDSTKVEIGEMVTYSLHLSGQDIVRPSIQTLCGVDVISTSSQTSIEMINGDISRSNILSYKFIPQKNCIIEPIEVEIGTEKQKSNSVSIEVSEIAINQDSDFILILESEKEEVYVGEPFELTLIFKQRKDAEAVDSKFTPPELKGFWIKGESKPQRVDDGKYSLTKIKYMIAAQRVGTLSIKKAQMRIASRSSSRDSWGSWSPKIKWKTYFSNDLHVDVKALPAGVDLVGDFKINADIDKKEINAGEAVNITIEVSGDGNLEDIKSFKPHIDGVSTFDEKIVLSEVKLTQKIAFVADSDFVIPPFSIKYFDPKIKEIKTISTDSIAIKVKNEKPKEELTIKRESRASDTEVLTSSNEISNLWLIVVFTVGLVSGILLMLMQPWKLRSKEKNISIKDPKVLLVKLLPYKEHADVQTMINNIEKSIYSDNKITIDKKLIKEIVQRYDIR
ncbi:MAG: BatD family protein [Campylobacterota bacterium]|nr:BatD family protein [Campylobacterota bacterium]